MEPESVLGTNFAHRTAWGRSEGHIRGDLFMKLLNCIRAATWSLEQVETEHLDIEITVFAQQN